MRFDNLYLSLFFLLQAGLANPANGRVPTDNKADLSEWYPSTSLALEEEGDATISYKVNANNKTLSCDVVKSSGFIRLDQASCGLIRKSFEISIKQGRIKEDIDIERVVVWRIPSDPGIDLLYKRGKYAYPYPEDKRRTYSANPGEIESGRRINVAVIVKVDAAGGARSCHVGLGSGLGELDRRSCEVAMRWSYHPARKSGIPKSGLAPVIVRWIAANIDLPSTK